MAVTALTPTTIDRSGTIVTPNTSSTGTVAGAGAGNGVTFPNSPASFLRVVWTAADTLTVAIPGGGPDGVTAAKAITLSGSSGDMLIGPFPISVYGQTVSAYAGLATTKVSAIQIVPTY